MQNDYNGSKRRKKEDYRDYAKPFKKDTKREKETVHAQLLSHKKVSKKKPSINSCLSWTAVTT